MVRHWVRTSLTLLAVLSYFRSSFDYFGRTSTELHSTICQGVYRNLRENGYLEKQDKEQVYCEGCPKCGRTSLHLYTGCSQR